MERELRWSDCWNVRDLGGYPVRDGRVTAWRRIVRAGNLSRLTDAGRNALLADGIRTVVDLRDAREFAVDLNPFHATGKWHGQVAYVHEPLISDAEWEAIRDPQIMKQGYVVTLDLSKVNIIRVLRAIANASPGGVAIHCHAGKERTGVVAALLLALVGVADELIADDYVLSDGYLTGLYAEWAAREPDPEARVRRLEEFRSKPQHMLEPLAYVRDLGGIEGYLRDSGSGLSAAVIEVLRARLLEADPSAASR